MTLKSAPQIADLLTSLGVLASLVFVGMELHRATAQSRLTNLRETLAGMNALRAVADDERMADIILRGRKGLAHLSETEALSYDRYLRRTVAQLRGFSGSAGFTIDGRSIARSRGPRCARKSTIRAGGNGGRARSRAGSWRRKWPT